MARRTYAGVASGGAAIGSGIPALFSLNKLPTCCCLGNAVTVAQRVLRCVGCYHVTAGIVDAAREAPYRAFRAPLARELSWLAAAGTINAPLGLCQIASFEWI